MNKCSVEGCTVLAKRKGMCRFHYERKRQGIPFDRPYRGRAGDHISVYGYRIKIINGIKHKEHRWIMEQHLGRPLLPTEVVHHKDGDKLNNSLDNLQLMPWDEHSTLHATGRVRVPKPKLTCYMCNHPMIAKGLCRNHYEEMRRFLEGLDE